MTNAAKGIENTYDWMDDLIRTALRTPYPDITAALYNGDPSLTLEQAQSAKHRMILEKIGFQRGDHVLDIGSGWGPMLNAIEEAGGHPVGVTLSPAQARYTKSQGFHVLHSDWQDLDPTELKQEFTRGADFDQVVSVGAFEHFCSPEQSEAGLQDDIYRAFFRFVSDVLASGSRMYLQTMTWDDPPPRVSDLSLDAPVDSPEYIIAHLRNFYADSGWLPLGVEHIMSTAPDFDLVSAVSGRKDYIVTMAEWERLYRSNMPRMTFQLLKLIPRLRHKRFRSQLASARYGANVKAFELGVFEHTRMVLQKI